MTERNGPLVLLTGATGYVGSRLLDKLQKRDYRIRCLARKPESLARRSSQKTEIVAGDLLDPASLKAALNGVDTAYYLVHSMGSSGDFAVQDRQAADNFAVAAKQAGVRQIVYLGGLGRGPNLSHHLASRQEVGQILAGSGVPTVEFRASIVIGAGSLSFEMIRSLVERLPAMVTPRWVRMKAQPIAIDDVVGYLTAELERPGEGSAVFEIGGADQVSYLEIMREYARQRGLRRVIVPVPVLSPWLSSQWLGLVTPLQAQVGRELVESLKNETTVRNNAARELFDLEPVGIRDAIKKALSPQGR